MSLSRHLAGLRARFDGLALRPPAAAEAVADSAVRHAFQPGRKAASAEAGGIAGISDIAGIANGAGSGETLLTSPTASASLQAWCWQGAGPGNSALWQPGARPRVAQRLAVAALRGPDAVATTAWANALARQIDGSARLDALPGTAARLALRLGVKAHDAMWWRARQADDPWDAGWAINTPPALRHWKARFMPRRATLVLADRTEAAALQACLAALVLRSDDLRHPVRWLWVGGGDDIAPLLGLAVARFRLG